MKVELRTSRRWVHLHCGGLGSLVVLFLVVSVAPPRALGQLVNAGFEGPDNLEHLANIVNPLLLPGLWGYETASVTPAVPPITPPEGLQMLRMLDAGLVATQIFQFVDVSPLPASPVANLSALFNSDADAAIGGVQLLFYSSPNYGSGGWMDEISWVQASLTLDNDPSTWESISLTSIPVPVAPLTTTWVGVSLFFNNDSIGSLSGYVDDVNFTIVPEPASLWLVGLGAAVALRRRPS